MHFLSRITLLTLAVVLFGAVADAQTGIDLLGKARREFLEGKNDRALTTIDEAEKRGLTSGKLTALRGFIFLEQGKFDDATKAFEAAQKEDKLTYGSLHVGDTLARQGKWDEARTTYQAALKGTDILVTNERLRFAIFITYLGSKDEEHAKQALDDIMFPTESAAYYYAQAAWSFAHGAKRDGEEWVKRAHDIFGGSSSTSWFERHLYDFGWLKGKPPPISD